MTNDLTARNAAIYQELMMGKTPRELEARYNLSARQIRNIRDKVANYQASDNGKEGGKGASFSEIGLSGLEYTSGYVQEAFLSDLNTSSKRYKQFNEMRQNSAVIGAMLLAVELSVRRVEFHFEGEENDERVEFLDGALHDMSHSFDDLTGEILTMLPFGWAYFETVYKRRQGPAGETRSQFDDGKIGWRKIALRGQNSLERWDFDDTGGIRGMWQRTYPSWKLVYLPIEKCLLFRMSKEKNNPEGRSLLRPAYVPYRYLKGLMSIEAIGIERDLAGLPKMYMGRGSDPAETGTDVTKAMQTVRRIRQDEQGGVVIPNPKGDPDGWEFELMGSPGGKQFNVDKVIARYEQRIAMTVLAQFLLLGMGDVGSYALSKDHSDFFIMAIGAIADNICDTFNRYAVPRLLELNGMPLEDMPKLTHDPLGDPDLDEIAQYFGMLANAGLIEPDVELEKWFRRLADAPELQDDEIERREAEKQEFLKNFRQPGQQPGGNGNRPQEPQKGPQAVATPEQMTLGRQSEIFAAEGRTLRQKVDLLPDDMSRRYKRSMRDFTKLMTEGAQDKARSVRGISDEEWQRAVEADEERERASGEG